MKRSGEGDHYERLEQRETDKLPDDLKEPWRAVLRRQSCPPLPFKHAGGRKTYRSLPRQSTATRAKILTRVNLFVSAAQKAGKYDEGFRSLIEDRKGLQTLFRENFDHLSGLSKWEVCRTLWRLGFEFYELDLQWLLTGGRRFRASHVFKRRKIDPYLPKTVMLTAERLSMAIDVNMPITIGIAIQLRTIAHISITANLKARLSELALLGLDQVMEHNGIIQVTVVPQHSKARVGAHDPLDYFASQALRRYLEHGRPVLLDVAKGAASKALWITEDGLKAEAGTMASALRRATRSCMPKGVASGDLRRAAVSSRGLSFVDQANKLKHVLGSMTAPRTYRGRDRNFAVKVNRQLSTVREDEVFSFPAVKPSWSRGKGTSGRG